LVRRVIVLFIDCDNGWLTFDGWMPFWQSSCIINCCAVIMLIVIMENELSLWWSARLDLVESWCGWQTTTFSTPWNWSCLKHVLRPARVSWV